MPATYDLLHFPSANGTTTFPNTNTSGDTWSIAVGGSTAQNTDAFFGGFVANVFVGNTARYLAGGDTTTDGGIKSSSSRSHTGTFCHEFWLRSANVAFGGCHWSMGDNSSSASLSLWQNTDGKLHLENGTTTIGTTASAVIVNATNYAIAVLRDSSNQIKVCVDGAVVITATLSGTISGVRCLDNCLASGTYSSSHYASRIDEYRGTDGDDRYTSFPYTPTTTEFVLDYAGITLTGVTATCSAGTVGVAVSKGLTGNTGTGSVGTVTAVNGGTIVALTGVTGTGSVGTVAPSASKALTGNTGTGSPGTVALAIAKALTGTSGTGSPGAVAANVAIGLTGLTGTGSVGAVAVAGSGAFPITGVSGTGSAGTVSVAATVPLTGASGTGSAGTVAAALSKAMTGSSATGSVGTVGNSLVVALAGNTATGSVGAVLPVQTGGLIIISLSGVSATGSVRSVGAPSVNAPGSGGGPLELFQHEPPVSAKERKRRKAAAAWAAREDAITESLKTKAEPLESPFVAPAATPFGSRPAPITPPPRFDAALKRRREEEAILHALSLFGM